MNFLKFDKIFGFVLMIKKSFEYFLNKFYNFILTYRKQKIKETHNSFELPDSILKTIAKKRLKTKIFRFFTISCLMFCFMVLAGLFLLNIKSAYRGITITTISIDVDKNEDFEKNVVDFFKTKTTQKVFNTSHSSINRDEMDVIKDIISVYYNNKKIKDVVQCNQDKNNCILTLKTSEDFDRYYKEVFKYKTQIVNSNILYNLFILAFISEDLISLDFNSWFFTNPDSKYAEMAGISVSLKGTFYIILVFIFFCVPLSIITALYLEEFATKNWITNLIELNINNLSAVPSIIYGLLGLLVYINYMSLPRSSAIVGGLTLSLLVMPILISSARNAIRNVPQILREITFAIGASKSRVVFGVVFPAALPGIFTGIILTLARLIGETAPLLIIGMVAFVGIDPLKISDPATAIPVQIYLWSSSPNYLLINKASLLILCLLCFLLVTNYIINIIRQRFEIKHH